VGFTAHWTTIDCEENMENRNTALIATLVTVLLCGLPGLVGICAGLLATAISFVPGAQIDVLGRNDPQAAFNFGALTFCVGILFVIIPILVGYFTLRRRQPEIVPPDEGPVPPAI
jgi:hypothetical protein